MTACPNYFVANDKANECDHPPKPAKPYSDQDTALFITAQAEKIDVCRALLGNKPRLK